MAARVGIVREAVGIAAYQTGRWTEALAELRAARRLTGNDDYLPLIADSERALGRLDRALAVIREADLSVLDRATQIELLIVESGIRRDQGLVEAAVVVLQVPELKGARLRPWSARLFYAYADALLAAGREEEARDGFTRAAAADPDGLTDADERLNELDGINLEDLVDLEDEDEDDLPGDEDGDGPAVDDEDSADLDLIVEVVDVPVVEVPVVEAPVGVDDADVADSADAEEAGDVDDSVAAEPGTLSGADVAEEPAASV